MKKIFTLLQPFDLKQTVITYEDGNKIAAAAIETADLAEGICKIAKAENIKEVDIGGPKQYSRGIAKKISETAAMQYDINDLEVKLI